jgi:CheY-like chemotaxis protein
MPPAQPNPTPFHQVLIIDDDSTSVYIAKAVFEDLGIAEKIISVSNGEEAIRYIEQHCMNENAAPADCPDLILLDINMPVMDGFEFLKALEFLDEKNLIRKRVIALTSSAYPKDKQQMEELGVSEFISKPITEEWVLSLIPPTT